MKILYHHRTLGDGAEGVHIQELVGAFRDLGHEVRVVSLVGEKSPSSRVKEQRWGRVGRILPSGAYELAELAYNIVGTRMLMSAIKEFQPDFIYDRYNSYSTAALRAGRRTNLPIVLEVNAPVAYERIVYKYMQLKLPWLAYRYERRICSGVDHVVTVSTVLKNYLIEQYGLAPQKISVLPNAINPKMFSNSLGGKGVREKYRLSQKVVIGFVGTLRAWHGIDLLMKVIPEVVAREKMAHFLIVGAGELFEEFRGFIKNRQLQNYVTLTGWITREEIPSHIATMDITLMPNSNFYGSPIKVFEYMGMAKPTIAPQLSPIEEIITNGEDGILIEPGSSDALRDAILDLIGKPEKRERMGLTGKRNVLANHTWVKNANSIIGLVNKTVLPS